MAVALRCDSRKPPVRNKGLWEPYPDADGLAPGAYGAGRRQKVASWAAAPRVRRPGQWPRVPTRNSAALAVQPRDAAARSQAAGCRPEVERDRDELAAHAT